MYAIKIGHKFINAISYTNINEVFDLKVCTKPKIYKTYREAERVSNMVDEYLYKNLAEYKTWFAHEREALRLARKDLDNLQARYDALMGQPYKLVYKQVSAVEKQMKKTRLKIKFAHSESVKRIAARLKKIATADRIVVKIQNTEVKSI